MSKLKSAMVVFGAIDEIALKARAPEIRAELNRLFGPTTSVEQRGWYGEFARLARERGTEQPEITAEAFSAALEDLSTVSLAAGAPNEDELTKYDLGRLDYCVNALDRLRQLPQWQTDPAGALFKLEHDPLIAVSTQIENQAGKLGRPATCRSSVREVRGEYCTVLLTEAPSDDVTLNELKAVLDPFNWPKLSTFFRDIEPRQPSETPRGWGRMLEVVETGSGDGFTLRTPLKFWKGELDDGTVFINYDLDDNAFHDAKGDGLVLVDNGYIVAKSKTGNPDERGVYLFTSKELLIRGMSPTAAANLACRLGWADAGDHMFFDTAERYRDLSEDEKQEWGLIGWARSDENEAAPFGPEPEIPPANWTLPGENRRQIIETAATSAQTIVGSASRASGEFMQKWQDGLTPEEITQTAVELGNELTRTYQSLFTTAMDAVRPATRRR